MLPREQIRWRQRNHNARRFFTVEIPISLFPRAAASRGLLDQFILLNIGLNDTHDQQKPTAPRQSQCWAPGRRGAGLSTWLTRSPHWILTPGNWFPYEWSRDGSSICGSDSPVSPDPPTAAAPVISAGFSRRLVSELQAGITEIGQAPILTFYFVVKATWLIRKRPRILGMGSTYDVKPGWGFPFIFGTK